jgi:hypothetical protein
MDNGVIEAINDTVNFLGYLVHLSLSLSYSGGVNFRITVIWYSNLRQQQAIIPPTLLFSYSLS